MKEIMLECGDFLWIYQNGHLRNGGICEEDKELEIEFYFDGNNVKRIYDMNLYFKSPDSYCGLQPIRIYTKKCASKQEAMDLISYAFDKIEKRMITAGASSVLRLMWNKEFTWIFEDKHIGDWEGFILGTI